MQEESKPLEELIPETIQRLMEASYFLQQTIMHYHDPHIFNFNLNATIQAIRNITFMFQSEMSHDDFFKSWYPQKQEEMKKNPLLRKMVEARNIIVKQKSLEARSQASVGLFVYLKLKIWIQMDVCPFLSSEELLKKAQDSYMNIFISKDHSADWEQLGVKREWIADQIGDTEVTSLCNDALDYFGSLLVEFATRTSHHFNWRPGPIKKALRYQLLLESDVDPTLPKRAGWEE